MSLHLKLMQSRGVNVCKASSRGTLRDALDTTQADLAQGELRKSCLLRRDDQKGQHRAAGKGSWRAAEYVSLPLAKLDSQPIHS